MGDSFLEQVRALHILFENGFADAYRNAGASKRRRLMPYISALYRRWYYSTLIENTPFTPANIMESICLHYGKDVAIYPLAKLRSESKFNGFSVELRAYSEADHAVAQDLKRLVAFCLPHIDLQERDCFFDEQVAGLSGQLSLADPAYAAYLLEIALRMKLVMKIPSLYVNRVQPARDWAERLGAPAEALFAEIVEATVLVSAQNMRELIPLPEPVFTDGFVRAMLAEPIETDTLFERVYDILGYTLEDLIELSMESDEIDFESQDGAFLAGTFLMGVVLDQHFYTPFGQYLKLIRPIYVLPFDFAGEMEDFLNSKIRGRDEVFIAFFAPCSNYTLTDMGLRALGVKPNERNHYDVGRHIPFTVLKDSLFADPEMIEVLVKIAQLLPSAAANATARPVYTFRVRMESDPTLWIHLHMPASALLRDLYAEAAPYFPIRENNDYSFFHDETENRFAEYPSPKRATPRNKKTTDTPLDALDFGRQSRMVLTVYNQALPFGGEPTTVRLGLEMMGKKTAEPGCEYPRVVRMSKAMQVYDDEG
jgi:hypothetical protein